jgi:hypothetical protein
VDLERIADILLQGQKLNVPSRKGVFIKPEK